MSVRPEALEDSEPHGKAQASDEGSTSIRARLRIFISHSSKDAEVAGALAELFRAALHLKAEEILCTSVDGYRLPSGADTDEQLREKLSTAGAVIGVVSPHGMSSAYVLFELGARWCTKKFLAPVLAPGVEPSELKGPIAGLNAVRCSRDAELHQLITDVARELGMPIPAPPTYLKQLRDVLTVARSMSSMSGSRQQHSEAQPVEVELTAEHLAVIKLLAATSKALYPQEIASGLGLTLVKAQHLVDVLVDDAGLLEATFEEYGHAFYLSKKGRADAVKRGYAG